MTRARCPECARIVATFDHRGRTIFVFHSRNGGHLADLANRCEASGWIVEDEEILT